MTHLDEAAGQVRRDDPFRRLRARLILPLMLAAFGISVGAGLAIEDLSGEYFEISLMVLFYFLLYASFRWMSARYRIELSGLVGPSLSGRDLASAAGLGLMAVLVSIGSLWLVFYPLSLVVPEFVNWWLIEDEPVLFVSPSGELPFLPNTAVILIGIVMAPAIEELLFRGLLLQRWMVKWGFARAAAGSSVLFGLLHTDFLGCMLFGLITAVVFVETRSILMPIVLHSTNNLIAYLVEGVDLIFFRSQAAYTLSDFQSDWWQGALGLLMGGPWLIRYLLRHWPRPCWRLPYAS